MRQNGQFPSTYIHMVWLPIGAFLLAELLVGFLTQAPVAVPLDLAPTKWAAWNEAAARMQLLGLLLLFLVSGGVVIVRFFSDLFGLFDAPSRKRLLVVYLLLFMAGVLVVAAAYRGVVPRSFELMGSKAFFESALTLAQSFSPKQFWSPRSFDIILGVVNVITGIAVPAFVAGGISCLATFKSVEEKDSWLYQSKRLAAYIYMSAGWLVIGTVFLKTWTQYPAFLLDKDPASLHSAMVNAYTSYTGIEYTLILAAYSLPTVLLMSQRANAIATTIAQTERLTKDSASLPSLDSSIREVQDREKLAISAQDVFKTILAVLAPLVTGSIASLSTILGKG